MNNLNNWIFFFTFTGRMFDYHVLDMIELGIEKFVSLKDVKVRNHYVGISLTSTGGFFWCIDSFCALKQGQELLKKVFHAVSEDCKFVYSRMLFLCSVLFYFDVLSILATLFAIFFFRFGLFLIFPFLIKELHLQNSLGFAHGRFLYQLA